MARMFFEDEPCQPDNFRCNRVCPRIAKAEFGRRFFSGEFRRRFDGGPKWITQLAGVFPVGVVNAPELTARLRSHSCAHAWQFTRNCLCEDVSATQNARTVRVMSGALVTAKMSTVLPFSGSITTGIGFGAAKKLPGENFRNAASFFANG